MYAFVGNVVTIVTIININRYLKFSILLSYAHDRKESSAIDVCIHGRCGGDFYLHFHCGPTRVRLRRNEDW